MDVLVENTQIDNGFRAAGPIPAIGYPGARPRCSADGATVVIGGSVTQQQTQTITEKCDSRQPPMIGYLFRGPTFSVTSQNAVFITPRISLDVKEACAKAAPKKTGKLDRGGASPIDFYGPQNRRKKTKSATKEIAGRRKLGLSGGNNPANCLPHRFTGEVRGVGPSSPDGHNAINGRSVYSAGEGRDAGHQDSNCNRVVGTRHWVRNVAKKKKGLRRFGMMPTS